MTRSGASCRILGESSRIAPGRRNARQKRSGESRRSVVSCSRLQPRSSLSSTRAPFALIVTKLKVAHWVDQRASCNPARRIQIPSLMQTTWRKPSSRSSVPNNAHYGTEFQLLKPMSFVKSGICREPNIAHSLKLKGREVWCPMPTSKECRQHAEECLQLAKQAEEFYVKGALIELAEAG
jgi:hypothetical protein